MTVEERHTTLVKPEPENAFKNFLCKGRRLAFVLLILSTLFIDNRSHAQIVINELGISATSGDAAGGGEFVELFNKSGCTVSIGCYVLVYSGTSIGAAGWSITIPSGTMLGSGQYYLIGGHGSSLLAQTSWTNGISIGSSWINSYGTNGKNVADLDLGTAYTSGKRIVIGNLINNDGQVTLFKSDGSVASSLSYNSGNNSSTYPVIPNSSTGCSLNSIANPGNSTANQNFTYSSYRTGLYLDANGIYQSSVNDPVPGYYGTPGKANSTNGISTQTVPVSLPAANAGTSKSITAGTPTSIGAPSVSGNTYSWTSNPSGFSSTSANPTVSPVITTTYTLTETDVYGCISTNNVVLSINAVTIFTSGTTSTLGCNPVASDINAALGTATATDDCGGSTLTPSDGSIVTTSCSRSQTRTWTAIDVCGSTATASRTVTWIVDVTGPTITTSGNPLALGCNPNTATIDGALGTATATDACSTPTVTFIDGAIVTNTCSRSQTRTFTAIDACGNTSTAARTATWTADITGPTITTSGNPLALGCNPNTATIDGALGTATATDACGIPTVTFTNGSISSAGCGRTQTRTFTAIDACGNTSTAARTATWTADVTGPTITTSGNPLALGCNPNTATIDGALGTATATDACSTPTVTFIDGAIVTNTCSRSQTRTFTAIDACGNTSTAARTATWTADITGPTITTSGNPLALGCNPNTATIDGALGTATATDACSTPTVTFIDGAIVTNTCSRSQTRTFTAIDACGNTSTTARTATWTADITGPTITTSGNPLALGCNPNTATIDGALGTATATDACGIPTVTFINGSISSAGCGRTQTRTFTAIDACGNSSTTSRTATWTSDVTGPTITTSGNPLALGCNPNTATIDGALGTATATDACSTPTVTFIDGAIVTNTCSRSQTRTFTAIDACGNTSTAARTATWTADITGPTITTSGNPLALGCNPNTATIDGALGTATATDACGIPTVTFTNGSISSAGCGRTQTRTFTAIDACGNTSTAARTATWTADVTGPTITTSGNPLALGCNPNTATIDGALGTATATDACSTPTVTFIDGAIVTNTCSRSQTRTFTAIDACGNTSTAARTATWTADITGPTITTSGNPLALGCNPNTATIDGALGTATATDACSTPTVTFIDGAIVTNTCSRSQTRTFTAIDACGNTSTAARTATWTADITGPTITTSGNPLALGCNPNTATIDGALGTATATDACGIPTVTFINGSISSAGCGRTQTRTFTAIDACGNSSTTSRTATWTSDVVPPVLNCPDAQVFCVAAGPNYTIPPATATDNCGGPVTLSYTISGATTRSGSDGNASGSFNAGLSIINFSATDACGNISTCSVNVTIAAPITISQNPSGITGCKTAGNSDISFTASSISGSSGTTAQWQVSADDITYTNVAIGTTTISTIAGVTTSQYTFTPGQSDMDKYYRVVFTNACGSVTSTGGYLYVGENITLSPGQNDFSVQFVACDQGIVCVSLSYTTPQNVVGYVHAMLEIGPSNVGPWTAVYEDSTIGSGLTTQTACFPVSGANNGWYLRWRIWNYGCEEYHAYPLPIIVYPPAVVTTVNSCIGGGPVTFTKTGAPSGGTWSINGGGSINSTTGIFTPTQAGCWIATYSTVPFAQCTGSKEFIVFPAVSAPTVNTGCGPIVVTPPPTVAGFNIEYSFDDGVNWGANTPPTAENCAGYKIKTRYVTIANCGSMPAGTASTTGCPSPATTRIIDLTPPAFTGTYLTENLGCNPSSSSITAALGSATATDACGTPTITFTTGPVQTNSCGRSQVRTFTARDGCGNTVTTSRTVTWIVDVTPPTFTGSYPAIVLGCNPISSIITAALGTASATDGCGTLTITSLDGTVQTNSCGQSQVRTFTATDGCGNTATTSRTVSWTSEVTPPAFTGSYTTVVLGCNPTSSAITAALGTATATDACGAQTIIASDGAIQTNSCTQSQVRTFTATDGCGNISTTSRTVSWTADVTPPSFTGSYTTLSLGCNPSSSAITAALGPASATDDCGTTTITSIDGPVQSSGCGRSQTRTFTARDGCNNTSSVSRTVTWTFDNTASITASGTTLNAGCNPSAAILNAALGTATSTDACSTPTVTQTDGPVTSTGCNRSQTRSWSLIDACGNTASTSRIVTWTEDTQIPTITATGTTLFICGNPNPPTIDAALGNATASDNCSTPTIIIANSSQTTVGCITTQTRTWTATDACGNTATTSRTVSWSNDNTPPIFTGTYSAQNLGCNPTSSAITTALGSATATDACGTPTINSFDGSISTVGCTRSQTRTFTATDACSNTVTISRTVNWTVDITAPVITLTAPSAVACNGNAATVAAAFGTASVSDNCSVGLTATGTVQPEVVNGCNVSVTKTWTVTDACGNTGTASQTITFTRDNTLPVITLTAPSAVACNGNAVTVAAAFGTASVSDNCSVGLTATGTVQPEVVNGCNVSVTKTWTVTDACGNTGTASQTITFTRDNTLPVITLTAPSAVACNGNAVTVAAAFGTASVSDNCSVGLTATGTVQPEVVNGCNVSVTKTWTVTDACGNTGTASQTITFTRDNTLPVITLTAPSAVACNGNAATVAAAFGTASVSDNCSVGLTATGTVQPEVVNGCNVSVTKTWTVTDACGNTGTASQTITFTRDNTLPVITLTAPSAVACNGNAATVAAAFGTASVSDNCSVGLTATGTVQPEVVNGCNVSVTKTWTVTDACGNTGTASQTITFTRDNTLPVITLTAPSAVACNGNAATVAAAFGTASVSDNCSVGLTATGTVQPEVVNGCNVSVTKTWTVTDACGNTGTASQTITFTRDNTLPVITLTAPSAVACNGNAATVAAAFGTASVSDNCSVGLTATGTVQPEVVNGCNVSVTKTWTVTDACGNTGTASQTITFTRDNTLPVITLTAPSAVACNGNATDVANAFGTASVSDNCSVGLTATGTVQPEVVNGCNVSVTKTWTVTDACGNTGTASQTITFTRDNTLPVITLTAPSAVACNGNAATVAAAFGTASVSDNCSVGLTATGTVQPEVVNGCNVSVTKTWTVTDACGNTGTASQTITFTRDNTLPVITLTAPSAVACNGNAATVAAAFGTASVSDNCSVGLTATGTVQPEVVNGCNVSVTKTWTVTDACGNTGTASQTITFTRDNTLPVITLTAPSAVACNGNATDVANAFGTASVSDNCSVGLTATGTVQPEVVNGCNVSVTKTWTVTDACGNTGTASQTITFTRDLQVPVISCPTSQVFCSPSGMFYSIPPLIASDNCSSSPIITYQITGATTTSGTGNNASQIYNIGVSIITWTVTDGCGNISTCSTTVTINQLITPTFNPVTAICSGATLAPLPTTSLNGINGVWSPALNNTTTTTYTFTPTIGQCATTTTLTITVNPILSPTINCGVSSTSAVTFNWAAVSGATGYSVSYQVNAGSVVNVGSIGNLLSYQVTGLTGGDNVSITVTPTGTGCFTAATATCTATACTPPTANISYATPFCADFTTPQSVTLNGTGTFTGGTYSASPAGLTINPTTGAITPSTSTPGTYTITYTIAASGGCPGVTATTPVTIAAVITPTFNPVAAICSGATLTPLPTTSLNGINGSWSPALNNTTTTTYTFTPTIGQCATTTTLTITVNPNVTPTFNPVTVICSGATLTPLPTTSLNSINGSWSPALNNTTTTTYTFTPTIGQCATTTTLTITVNPNVTPTFNPVTAICSGATLTPLPTTSLNGINGSWSPALNNTTTTTYTFTPTIGQCATTTTLTITVNPNVTPTFNPVAAICSGATLTPLPTTSLNGINGSWSPALNNTTTTTYTFTPTIGQCATTTTLTITVNPNVTPTFNPVAAICSGATLTPLPTTSLNGINGVWSPALNNTTTTTYTFTPTIGQCATTTTLTITVNPILSPTINCGVSSTSAVTFNWAAVSGATGYSASYQVNAGSVVNVGSIGNLLSYQVTGLTGGDNVSITVTPTGTGCFTAATATCTATACTPPTANISYATPFCADLTTPQTVTLTGTGTFTGGTYSASPAGLTINPTSGAITPSTSTPGSYTVTYTIAASGGCPGVTATTPVTIDPIITPTFNPVAAICSGATLVPLPTTSLNGINGSWSPALNNTTTTTYTFTPTIGQCATTTTLTITVNSNVTPTFNPVTAICSGATLVPLPTTSLNGINGSWSPALNNTTTTTYTFTPTIGQCATTTTLTITVNPNVTPIFNPVTAICSGATLVPLPTTSLNGINGSWSPALNNTTTTTYTFTPTIGQCATTTTLTITVNSNVTPTFNPVTAICSGATLTPLPTISLNGINGSWSPALNNTTTTTYTFTPTIGQCATTTTLTITVNPILSPTINCGVSSTSAVTFNWAVVSGATGYSVSYQVNAGSVVNVGTIGNLLSYQVTGLTGGDNVSITVTPTGTGCFTAATATCTATACTPPTASISYATPFCADLTTSQTVTLTGTGTFTGGTYSASPAGLTINATTGAITPSTSTPGAYTVTYTIAASGGCPGVTATTPITIDPIITPTFNPVAAICSGATLVPLPTTSLNGINGSWSPALNNTTTTTYTFTPTIGQCATTTTLTITVNSNVTPTFNPVTAICSGATLVPLPTTSLNGINGSWSPALNNTTTTTYTFTPTIGQCATTTTLTITVNPNVTPTFNPVTAICSGATLVPLPTTSLNGINGSWSPALNNTTTTTYTFTPTIGQCATTTTLTITVNSNVTPTFNPVTAICSGATLTPLPTISLNGINGSWSPALNNTTTTTYTFTPTIGQCATTTTLTITVNPILSPTINCGVSSTSAVTFNWAAVSGATGYSVSYQVNAGSVVNVGSIGNLLSYQVTGLTGGDNVSITVTPTGTGCFTAATATCTATACTPPTANISYATPFCADLTTPQSVTLTGTGTFTGGTYSASPAGLTINATTGAITPSTSTPGAYTVTYTIAASGGCPGVTATTPVTIDPIITPTFNPVAAICSGATLVPLPTTSLNGINGSWSPALNNTTTTTYTFTPTIGQCATTTTLTITVNPNVTPTFNPVTAICSGATLVPLPTTSLNGINGSWSPALNNTTTTTYTFTPTIGQCATTTTLTITVNSNVTPTFNPVTAICSGATLTPLPTISLNGINGSWSPALNNTTTTTYTFTPTIGQCATTTTLTITVNPILSPTINCGVSSTSAVTFNWAVVSGATGYSVSYQVNAGSVVNVGSIGNVLSYQVTGLTGGDNVSITVTPTGTGCFTAATATCTANACTPPTASISYATPFCADLTTPQTVTLTGTGTFTGGTYSASPAGLTINATTGAITPSTSTPGAYTVTYTVAASGGCPGVIATTPVTIDPIITPTFNPVAAICSGATLVPLPTTSLNGINGSWSPALNNTTTTTYTFTPTIGQCATTTTLIITVNPILSPTINCGVSSTSAVTFNWAAVSGASGYSVSYQVNAGSVVNAGAIGNVLSYQVTGLTGGDNVTITVTPTGTGCFTAATATCTATACTPPTANISYATPFCADLTTPQSVTLTGTGTFTGGTYSASPAGLTINATTGAITPSTSTPGAYTVTYTVAASGGCPGVIATTPVTIDPIITPTFNAVAAICSGATLVPLPTTSLNGINGSWSPALNNTTTTTYTFTPTIGQCATTTTLTITVNPILSPTINCGVSSTSVVTFNWAAVSGATGYSVSYQVNAGSVVNVGSIGNVLSYQVTGLTGGDNVTITVTPTGTGCFTAATATCTATACTPPTANISYATPFCADLTTPQTVTLNGTGTFTGGAYSASPAGLTINATTGAITPSTSTPGAYTVTYTVAASGGCPGVIATTPVTIDPIIIPTFNAVAAICSGATLVPLPTTSLNDINGSWSPALNNTTTTTYTFTPTIGQCATTTTLIITVNPILSPTINCGVSSTSAVTFNWAAVSGASGYSVSYQVNAGSVVNAGAIGNVLSYQVTGLTGGDNVSITVTPTGTGCFAAATATCTATACTPPTANISYATPFCADLTTPQTVTLNGTGTFTGGTYSALPAGLTINATSGAITPSTSTPGTYTVTYTVAASGGCPGVIATTPVTIDPIITPTFNAVAAICSGATLVPLPTTSLNGINGSWSPALNNTTTTTYTFTPTIGQCATTTTLIITVNPILSPTINCGVSSTTAVTFNWAAVSGASGYSVSYQVNAGSVVNAGAIGNLLSYQVTGLTGGDNVTITVTPTGTGCFTAATATCTATVAACPTPTAGISYTSPFCADLTTPQTVTLNGTGTFTGGTYSASPAGLTINATTGAVTPSTSTPGSYTVTYTVAASGGCPDLTATTSVTIAAVITPTFSPVAAICSGATLTPLPTTSLNGINGSWSPALNNTTTTTYTFTPTAGQCATPVTMTITVNNTASSEFTAAACFLYNLPWGDLVTTSGDYVHTYQTINGCDSIVTAHITINNTTNITTSTTVCVSQLPFVWNGNSFNAPGTYSLNLQNATGCNFIATLILAVNANTTSTTNATICSSQLPFSWNGNTYNAAGTYSVTLQNFTSCDSIAKLNLTVNAASTSITRDSICANQAPYIWNGNSYNASGIYTANLVNATGCDSIATLVLLVKSIPALVINQPPAVCEPLSINLTAPSITDGSDPGLIFTYWMDSLATIPLLNPNAISVTGTYYIKAQGVNSCTSTKPVAVIVRIIKNVAGIRYPTVTTNANIPKQLSARNISNSYVWSPPVGLSSAFIKDPVFNYDRQTEYLINITMDNGCITVDTVLVKITVVIPPVVSDLFVPKAWTPNNDGHNDKLFPITVNIRELKYFRIFNRWGQLVFETNIIGEGWNGILQSKPAAMDVYTWTVEAIGVDGKYIKKAGNSVLIR